MGHGNLELVHDGLHYGVAVLHGMEINMMISNPHPERHRMLGYPPSAETLRLIGLTGEEWQFIQGRYEWARRELTSLRTSIKRIAECTKDLDVQSYIPAGDEKAYDERGWNALCAVLVDHVERMQERIRFLEAAWEEQTRG